MKPAEIEATLQGLLEAAPDAIVIVNNAGDIVLVNAQTETMFEYSRSELVGRPVEVLVPPRYRKAHLGHRTAYQAAPRRRPMGEGRILWGCCKSGREFPVEIALSPLALTGENLVVAIVRDATRRWHYEQELEQQKHELERANVFLEELASCDGLTGLKNYRALRQKLNEEINRAHRYKTPLSLLLLDLDRFKQYNDRYGHLAGDEVLRGVAQTLQDNARQSDYVARYGGEEFVILLPNIDAAGAVISAERYRAAIAAVKWPLRPITASFGAATLDGDLRLPAQADVRPSADEHSTPATETEAHEDSQLLLAADRALYHSKRKGRNRVTHADAMPPGSS